MTSTSRNLSTSVSRSYPVEVDNEMKKLIRRTASLRKNAIYLAELREWSELPLYKRLFKKPPGNPTSR